MQTLLFDCSVFLSSNLTSNMDHHQKQTDLFFMPLSRVPKNDIKKSIHIFLSYFLLQVVKQTYKQTDSGKNISFLAEVIIFGGV